MSFTRAKSVCQTILAIFFIAIITALSISAVVANAETLFQDGSRDNVFGTWETGTSMHFSRAGHVAATVNGKIYVIGGMYYWDQAVSDIESYDPSTQEWTVIGP